MNRFKTGIGSIIVASFLVFSFGLSIFLGCVKDSGVSTVSGPASDLLAAAPAGTVIVFQNCNYGGYAVTLGVGTYTLAQLKSKGVRDNDVSSIQVASGIKATLYNGDNFSGSTLVRTSNASCLTSNSFNDMMTSLKVEKTTTCTPTTIVPYIQVNGGSWQNTASVTVASGVTVKFGPQPTTGGSWKWSGPNSFSSTSREVTISSVSSTKAGNYTATYTNTSGCTSTKTFTITLSSSGGGGTWRKANLTWFTSYPDPNSEECIKYNGCTWAGYFSYVSGKQTESWVQSHNIIAIHCKDGGTYKLKTFRIRQKKSDGTYRQIDAKVYDCCSDSDCGGCCTDNANAGGIGFLIDMESYTKARFGSGSGVVEWQCLDCN